MKKYADFFASQIDVITNFAVITNIDIKRVHFIFICFIIILFRSGIVCPLFVYIQKQ